MRNGAQRDLCLAQRGVASGQPPWVVRVLVATQSNWFGIALSVAHPWCEDAQVGRESAWRGTDQLSRSPTLATYWRKSCQAACGPRCCRLRKCEQWWASKRPVCAVKSTFIKPRKNIPIESESENIRSNLVCLTPHDNSTTNFSLS